MNGVSSRANAKIPIMLASKFWLISGFALLFSPLAWASRSTSTENSSPFSWGAMLQLFAALVFVLIVFFGVIWVLKRFQPGLASAQTGSLRVLASLPLGVRERLLLVQVGEQQLLLGVTPSGISLLHTLETMLPETTSNSATAFAGWLRTAMERRKQGSWSQTQATKNGASKASTVISTRDSSSPD